MEPKLMKRTKSGLALKDKLNQAAVPEVARGIVSFADIAQKLPPHIRLLAAAGFLTLLVERMDLQPQDVMTALGNIRAHADTTGVVEIKAIEAYLQTDF